MFGERQKDLIATAQIGPAPGAGDQVVSFRRAAHPHDLIHMSCADEFGDAGACSFVAHIPPAGKCVQARTGIRVVLAIEIQ